MARNVDQKRSGLSRLRLNDDLGKPSPIEVARIFAVEVDRVITGCCDQVKIGLRIKALRGKTGLNQDDFAAVCGVHRAYVGKIENGRFDLRITTLHRIARGLKTNLSSLLKGID